MIDTVLAFAIGLILGAMPFALMLSAMAAQPHKRGKRSEQLPEDVRVVHQHLHLHQVARLNKPTRANAMTSRRIISAPAPVH